MTEAVERIEQFAFEELGHVEWKFDVMKKIRKVAVLLNVQDSRLKGH